MTWDLRPHYPLLAGDGQINNSEGIQPDEWENCTFEALRETLRAYGVQNLPDDERMREMVDPGSHGGESWGKTQTLAAKLAPSIVTSWEFPGDIVAAISGYGARGFVVHVGFYCDTDAWVPPQGTPVASHAEVALWDDGSGQGFRNVWPHPSYHLTYTQVRSLYDGGGILVFKRSLIPAPTPAPQEDVMPAEVIVARAKAPEDLCDVNTGQVRAFVVTRETAGQTCSGTHVLVGYDGKPIDTHDFSLSAGKVDVWGVPDGKVGVLVWSGLTGAASVDVKFGTR